MTYQTRVAADGRLEVPAEQIAALGFRPGDLLEVGRDGSRVVVSAYADIVKEGQRRFQAMLPDSYAGSLVDELIADRRAEDKRE